jgi:tetratricopeptide (TPR) repeat protein
MIITIVKYFNNEVVKVKTFIGFAFLLLVLAAGSPQHAVALHVAQEDTAKQVDMQQVLMNWSLFFEDYRNGYYERAIPYGWKVMELHPTRFGALYRNLAECYRQLYLATDDPALQEAYADTIIYIFQKGIEYLPDRADNFHLQKAHFYDNYYSPPKIKESIHAYQKAVELDFEGIDFQYIDRLGNLYMDNRAPDNDYEERAIELYQRYLTERDPDSATALDRLRRLVRDPHELVRLAEEKLRTDPDNPANIWGLVHAYSAAQEYQKAIPYVERLTEISPDSETYWGEAARLYERINEPREAIRAYSQLMRIRPGDRETPLKIAQAYRLLGNHRQAREYARRAQRMDSNWGEPLMEIATIYEEVIEKCVVNTKGGWANMKLEDRIVYKLAQEYYQRAAQIDQRVATRARERAQFLNNLIPQDEDYFFNRDLISNGKIQIFGDCYEWINEEITVPPSFR